MTEKKKTAVKLNEKKVDKVARLAYRAGMALSDAFGEVRPKAWEAAAEETREITRQGVRLVMRNPHVTPELIHKAWVSLRQENGWTFGEQKDAEAKTHPYMVEFASLPQRQRLKDCVFVETIKAALEVL